MRHEEALDHVVAEGNVVASDGNQIVEAERLVYNKRLNTITATGNVHLYQEDGSVVKTNYVELSADFKEAFLQNGYLLTSRKSDWLQGQFKRMGRKQPISERSIPCHVCKAKEPLWKLKAKK